MPRVEQRAEQRTPTTPARDPQRRRIRLHNSQDKFHYDESRKPEEMTYEWKRESVFGAPDRSHQIGLAHNYWTHVPADRHPELMGDSSSGHIKQDGLVLMERHEEITAEARELDQTQARVQVKSQMQRIDQSGHSAGGKGIKRSYESIVEDD